MSTFDATELVLRRLPSEPRRYEIVLYDYDDTLASGQPCHIKAWKEAVEKVNQTFPNDTPLQTTPEFLAYQKGRANDDAVKFWGIDPRSEKGRLLIGLKKEAAVANAHLARWFGDALITLPRLPERGYQVRIVTSSQRRYIEAGLEGHTELRFLLSLITAREDYTNGKSEPDCLVQACKSAGVPLTKAIYVGDALVDYRTTEAAGCAFLLYSPGGWAPRFGP